MKKAKKTKPKRKTKRVISRATGKKTTKAVTTTKRRSLIKEITELLIRKGPDKVVFKECRKLAREIKPDTTYNEVYHKILVSRVKAQIKKAKGSSKRKKASR
ncbi:hypothetical protein LCGC14_1573890 [marine sediment metagenome]|uniref:Uncharacterized protein n=1 Tax=marine sediment metagenome TaxID=412755 RepID=A0A0F9IIW0_9ZZZZ